MAAFVKSACVRTLTLVVLLVMLDREDLSEPPIRRAEHSQQSATETTESDRIPIQIRAVRPVYPETAREAGVRGLVIVSFTVGVEGTVTHAKIERSVPLLDQAALDAVKQWQFKPALSGGVPVPATRLTALAIP